LEAFARYINSKGRWEMKKTLSNIIRDWVGENKQIFWKYEVSSFYQTYKIHINNLPDPSEVDVSISSHNRLLNNSQKKQLCSAVKKACTKAAVLDISHIDVKVDYIDGAVVADLI
jgi:hypothetical protein